jgi:hypothetical protein
MKNFMYLSILAVLFLCGCKSNSFTTQRYTHFDNNTSKGSLKKPATQDEKPAAAYVASAAGPHSLYISDVFDTYTKPVEEAAAEKENAKQHSVFTGASKNSSGFHSISAGFPVKVFKSSAQRVIKAGMKQQAKAARHGLIFGIINLALFIVLCVIFVAGVIFLIMLLAV